MKAIVEQYAKGIFAIDRPLVRVSEDHIQKSIEAGTLYAGSFMVESENDYPIKGMVYDSRYILRFETHNFISRRFEVKYTLDATCLEEGQTFSGHISVITDGGEFSTKYGAITAGEIYATIRQLQTMKKGLEAVIRGLESALDECPTEGE